MRRSGLVLLAIVMTCSLPAQETRAKKTQTRRGEVAGYASRDATIVSMMGWGVLIFAGIATLVSLLDNNDSSSSH